MRVTLKHGTDRTPISCDEAEIWLDTSRKLRAEVVDGILVVTEIDGPVCEVVHSTPIRTD